MTQLRSDRSRRRFIEGSAAAVAGFTVEKAAARAAQFEFKCASTLATNHPASIRLSQMWAAIEQESGGRIHTQYYPSGSLGTQSSLFSQMRVGAIQFHFGNPGNVASVVPIFDITFLGFIFNGGAEGLHAMDGPLGGIVRADATAKGLHAPRTMWDSGMNQVCANKRAIRTADDLGDFKIRVAESKVQVDLFKTLGANPVALSDSEMYTALQTKLVDGAGTTLAAMETGRYYEVTKYISITNHVWAGLWLIANGDAWKSLPPDLQEVVERNNTKYALLFRQDIATGNAALTAQLTRQGAAFNPVDPATFRGRLRSYYDSWAKTFGPTAWGSLESSLGRKLA